MPHSGAPIQGLAIRRLSTADQVANVLRERILAGDLPPGRTLQEATLAGSIGVSRNTMREAIRVLVHEGLLRHHVHRGIAVTALTRADVTDIYRSRRLLEVAGVEASRTAPAAAFETIAATVDQMQRSAEANDRTRVVASDMLFHCQIVSFLESRRLETFFATMLTELRLALVLVDEAASTRARMASQHKALLSLLRERKVKDCTTQLLAHLDESERHLLEVISRYELDNPTVGR